MLMRSMPSSVNRWAMRIASSADADLTPLIEAHPNPDDEVVPDRGARPDHFQRKPDAVFE
jgi:hypothetical protein